MYGHIRINSEVIVGAVGIRQTGGRDPAIGKDLPDSNKGQASDEVGTVACGQTPTAEIAISALVRTKTLCQVLAVYALLLVGVPPIHTDCA